MTFDRTADGRQHRYRVRDLRGGWPVLPARARRVSGSRPAFTGDDDRLDAIVSARGYVTPDRDRLDVFTHHRSLTGLTYGLRQLAAAGPERVRAERVPAVADGELGDALRSQHAAIPTSARRKLAAGRR